VPGNIERGLLQGAGFGRLPTVGFVNLDFQVNEGDPVVTSGIRESLFPPDIPVGRVADVKRTPGSLQLDVRVEPAADLNRLQFVAVLRYLPAS
jgi:rod shape-determining protein MreC